MLKIWGRKSSSNVQKVLWCCAELGLAYEREDVGGEFGRNDSPEYRALNPNGVVPTIRDGDLVLWESNVIVRYLSAKYGLGKLCPAGLEARADCERWMDWQQTTLQGPMGILFRTYIRKPGETFPAKEIEGAAKRAGDAWGILDRQLAGKDYVTGATLTMADIVLGNAIHRWFSCPIERPALANLRAWYDRLGERPDYRTHILGK